MIKQFANYGKLITRGSPLPELPDEIENLYLDLETTSGDTEKSSVNPWHNCELLGAAFTWDDHPHAYYLPVRHRLPADEGRNLDIYEVHKFLRRLVSRSRNWTNHNIKYDANVLSNSCFIDVLEMEINLRCTLTMAKIWDSDRYQFDLTTLSQDVLFEDISGYEREFLPYLKKGEKTINRDYGLVPLELMAVYACQDALSVRKLYKFFCEEIDLNGVWATEQKVTKALLRIEQRGIEANIPLLAADAGHLPVEIHRRGTRLRELVGHKIHPNKPADCLKLFCEILGLPIVETTLDEDGRDTGRPSFGKDALLKYSHMAPTRGNLTAEEYEEVLILVNEFKTLFKLHTSFVNSYIKLMTGKGTIHGTFNQCVRTARFSQSEPNLQQANKPAKRYFKPRKGYCFVYRDLSQVEPRITAHYIKNEKILKAYREDPSTDYYIQMKDICNIDRDAAKAVFLAFTYSAGVTTLGNIIRRNMRNIPEGVDFDTYCYERAKDAYGKATKAMPEVKNASWQASRTLRRKGFVRNLFGRKRKLPRRFHSKAFNNVIQSTAADLMKAITVDLDEVLIPYDSHIVAIVHDSWLMEVPLDRREEVEPIIDRTIEGVGSKLTVPIYCSGGWSDKSWEDCE